jgi:hypothetical protein
MRETVVYALTPNGREILQVETDGGTNVYLVQPKNDNYWLVCRTPHAALQAFHSPGRFRQASARLTRQHPDVGVDL